MAEPITFPTKAARLAAVRAKLATEPKWAVRALTVVYEGQTSQEQQASTTVEDNGMGFSAFDAEILSSFAQQVERWNRADPTRRYATPLSEKQMALLFKRIPKYAGQLLARTNLADTYRVG